MNLDKDIKYFSESCGYEYVPELNLPMINFRFKGRFFKNNKMFAVIKISRSDHPRWGINANIVEIFKSVPSINFSAIFLTSKISGYYYTLYNLNLLINNRKLVKIQKDFKINSPLANYLFFNGIDKFKNLAF